MVGYLFYCPDTGTEWSLNHPIRSGEIPDAQNIRKATAEALLEELKDAWTTIRDRDQLIDHFRGILGPIAAPDEPLNTACQAGAVSEPKS